MVAPAELEGFLREFEACAVAPTRRHLASYVAGLLSPLPRKSVGAIARQAGVPTRTLQELLSLHRWDEGLMRAILHRRVARGHRGPEVLGWIHEAARVKKGRKTPGVHRQYFPPAGRLANFCVTLHLTLADGAFQCLLDSDLYLPAAWAEDRARRREAGIPDGLKHRTRGKIALDMVDRALRNGVEFGVVLVEEGPSLEPYFLKDLEGRGLPFLAAAPGELRGWAGRDRSGPARPLEELAQGCARGGEFLAFASDTEGLPSGEGRLFVLPGDPPGFFLTNLSPLLGADRVRALVGRREALTAGFEEARSRFGLDDFEVRTYRSLQRHFILTAVAELFCAERAPVARGIAQ